MARLKTNGSMTHFFLGGAVQHDRGPDYAVVPFVEVAVVGGIKVSQDEHRLEVGVLPVGVLLDVVGDDARGVDILNRS